MASVTRSSRRAEGLHPHHGNGSNSAPRSTHTAFQAGGGGGGGRRAKRILDVAAEPDFEAIKHKKSRIAVEILAKPLPRVPSDDALPKPVTTTKPKPTTAVANATTTTKAALTGPADAEKNSSAAETQETHLTKHQAKVINGIKHELDRLQPESTTISKEQGRKLRSQEATRFKSDLSAYFPDYDEVIGNEPKEQHLLNVDTPIVLIETGKPYLYASSIPGAPQLPHQYKTGHNFAVQGYGDILYTDVFDTQRIDFSFLDRQHNNTVQDDPLPDSLFEPVHKRAERTERSIRNSEKGRAQHEKDQIIRLLEGLQGHDWLRVMGVSGVTETKKKTFEPARRHFIHGCQAILEKFRNWNQEEKRRKLEKERAMASQAEASEAGDLGEGNDAQIDDSANDENEQEGTEDGISTGDTSEASSPAKQLREEAMARSKLSAKAPKKPRPASRPQPPRPPEPPKEFTSFFAKRHERDGALNRHRRAGRKVFAWGQPVPEIPDTDFLLPEEYRDEEMLKTRARKKRRDKRGSRQN